MGADLRKLKKFRLPAAVLILVVSALTTYLLRGGFRRFGIAPYKVPPAAFTNWGDVLRHPLFGDGSLLALSVPGHTDDDIAYLVNGPLSVLVTGDASHFEWAFKAGVAPRGWNQAGTARAYQSLVLLREFARAYPSIRLVYGHESRPS